MSFLKANKLYLRHVNGPLHVGNLEIQNCYVLIVPFLEYCKVHCEYLQRMCERMEIIFMHKAKLPSPYTKVMVKYYVQPFISH